MVDKHGFVVAFFREAELVLESFFLVDGIVELRVSIGKFLAVYHQLKAFCKVRIVAVFFCKRRHLNGVIGDERRLNISAFTEFSENFIDEFALAHGVVNFHIELLANVANFVFSLSIKVVARLLLDSFEDRQAAEGSFEANGLSVDHAFGLTIYCHADALQ